MKTGIGKFQCFLAFLILIQAHAAFSQISGKKLIYDGLSRSERVEITDTTFHITYIDGCVLSGSDYTYTFHADTFSLHFLNDTSFFKLEGGPFQFALLKKKYLLLVDPQHLKVAETDMLLKKRRSFRLGLRWRIKHIFESDRDWSENKYKREVDRFAARKRKAELKSAKIILKIYKLPCKVFLYPEYFNPRLL